jgi:phosphatidate phosphatase APP1
MNVFRTILCLLACCVSARAAVQTSNIRSDHEIVFFPAVAQAVSAAGKNWDVEIRGCVYENEKHRLALAMLREALAINRVNLTKAEADNFNWRTRLFMVEHESGRKIVIRIGGERFTTTKTKSNGEFSAKIRLSDEEVQKLGSEPVEFQAVLPAKDHRSFKGTIFFAPADGITVISDVDDTIKVTDVLNHRTALKNTFLEPFKAVPGMARLYTTWATNHGAQFYYISASPWQLFLPLTDFLHDNGFPIGVFCLKEFWLMDKTRYSIFENPQQYKPPLIEPILKSYPERKFVMVGDSGERDPEIYGDLARAYRKQIEHIFIRDVTGDSVRSARYALAFRELPASIWTLFHDPAKIADFKPVGH